MVGVLRAKLKLHKITPNTQGIRRYDVMISGEVQSLCLTPDPEGGQAESQIQGQREL